MAIHLDKRQDLKSYVYSRTMPKIKKQNPKKNSSKNRVKKENFNMTI